MTSQEDQGSREQVSHGSREAVQRVRIVGLPPFWQMAVYLFGTAAFIIVSLATAGAWYLDKSLEATQAKLSESMTKSLSPVVHKQGNFEAVARLLAAKSTGLTDVDRQVISDLLSRTSQEAAKSELEKLPNTEKKSLDQLILDKKVVQVAPTVKLKWDGDHPAQIRFIKSTDPNLDFSKIAVYSEDDDPCRSKVFRFEESYDATVQVCETHLGSARALEFVVIMNASPSEDTSGDSVNSTN
jgi:hypothetical protein